MLQQQQATQHERDAQALREARRLADEVLRPMAGALDRSGAYPTAVLQAIAATGIMGMSIPQTEGGLDLSYRVQVELFATLAEGCLAITFILTQHHGCSTLFTASPNTAVRARWLPQLASGAAHGASGFNFLNLPPERATMLAKRVPGGYCFNGSMPWVTAAHHSAVVAAGGVLPDMNQILVAVDLPQAVAMGTARIDPPMQLAALTASDTTVVHFTDLFAPDEDLILGPTPAVLKAAPRPAMVYVPTALTVGHARASLNVLEEIAAHKGGTAREMAHWVRHEADRLERDILGALASGDFDRMPELRGRGNVLAARAAHLALIAAGGTGYRVESPAQRLYREAGFFSIWSASGQVVPATLAHLLQPLV